jgi:hypothetical protein
MCWIKFYVCVCLVHTGANTVRACLFGILYNQNIINVMYVECYIFGVLVNVLYVYPETFAGIFKQLCLRLVYII